MKKATFVIIITSLYKKRVLICLLWSIGILTFLCSNFFTAIIFADTTSTSCFITKVGNPTDPQPTLPPECTSGGGGGSSDIVKVGEDIKTSYDACENGLTFEQPGLADCLAKELSNKGYAADQINNFETRRQRSFVNHSGPTGSGLCTECLGYVGTVIALWANTSVPEQTLNTQPTAGAINYYYASSGFEAGGKHWAAVGSGVSVTIQPGDIAVAGSYDPTTNSGILDHIAFVHDIIDDATFHLLESNGGYDCRVSYDRVTSKDRYTFYRPQ